MIGLRSTFVCTALLAISAAASGQATVVSVDKVSAFLARELPYAIKSKDLRHLDPYFADNVELRSNLPNVEPIKGKKWVLLALSGQKHWTSSVNGVVASSGTIAVVQNLPNGEQSDENLLAPKIDIFHLNSDGRIVLVETTIGDRKLSTRISQ